MLRVPRIVTHGRHVCLQLGVDLDLALDERVADGDAALDQLQSEVVHVGGGRHLDTGAVNRE